MKAMWWAVACVGMLLCPSAARADAPGPSYKFYEVLVVIDNPDDYPNRAFYLVAAGTDLNRPSYPTPVVAGEPARRGIHTRWLFRARLVAVPREWLTREGGVTWDLLGTDAPGIVRSNIVELPPSRVSVFSLRDCETRHFRIALTDNELTLTPGPVEQGSDGFSSWLPGLAAAAAVTALGFWVVRHVRRRRRSPTVPTKGQ